MSEKPAATILVVDDTESSRYAVCRILRKAGFEVEEAGTGEEALCKAVKKPDLIILDVQLPDVNGYEVCRRLKAQPTTASIPVLHLSASFVGSDNRSEGLESGADGYLVYPLEPRELIAHVRALLRVHEAEKTIRAERELLRVTLGSIADGVVATDLRGVVTFINRVAQGLSGWGEEAAGKPINQVLHFVSEGTDEKVEVPVDRVIQSRERSRLEGRCELVARDGKRRPVEDTAAPILGDQGQAAGVVLVFRDVSVRRRLEEDVQRQTDELIDKDRRKDEFLATLAHELRNPLAPIANALQIMRLQDLDPSSTGRWAQDVIGRQVQHLTRLVDDLLDVSRITRGKVQLRKDRVSLADVVARAEETSRPLIDAGNHTLTVSLPQEPLWLEGDLIRLAQIVANLLNNAAKYTDRGGRITLTASRQGDAVALRVRDTGIGIRPEMLSRVFDLFSQAERSLDRAQGGLGIGLSLVRGLVELHGGTVSVASEGLGKGTEFTVTLPLFRGDQLQGGSAGLGEAPAGRRQRILVVDDNPDTVQSTALLLRYLGHEVSVANNGPAALDLARTWYPHVVLLDIGLPGMDGYTAARLLRKIPGMEKVVLVAVSGYGQEDDRQKAREAGFDHHLVKPADGEEVQRLLASGAGSPA